jgi:hypothetical protein
MAAAAKENLGKGAYYDSLAAFNILRTPAS